MADWASTISLSGCGTCCGGVCPCDVSTMPSTLNGLISWLSGFCTAMGGVTFVLTKSGASWSVTGFAGGCIPVLGTLTCIDTGGGIYKFRLNLAFGADLSMIADSTSITCSPVDIEFSSVDLIWSGANGTSLCCPIGTDTGVATVIGNFKIKITS